MSQIYETIISKLGSRISMNFRPRSREIFISPMGRFYDKALPLNFGIVYDGIRYGLPFSRPETDGIGKAREDFQYVEQSINMQSVEFRCRDFRIGVDCSFTFTAPFYPHDEKVSTAPFFYVDVRISRLIDRYVREDDCKKIAIFAEILSPDFKVVNDQLYCYDQWNLTDDHIHVQDTNYLNDVLRVSPKSQKGVAGELCLAGYDTAQMDGKSLNFNGEISQNTSLSASYILAGFVAEEALIIQNDGYVFRYNEYFKNIEEVIAYARSEKSLIESKMECFENIFSSSSIACGLKNLTGLAFQTFLSNTWWMQRISDKQEWFSVWEGNCMFHSTIDVEYNLGLVYFCLWPELIEMTLREWELFKKNGFMSHDIGMMLDVKGQMYPHDMEIEENCDFILMLLAYWRIQGKTAVMQEHYQTVKELLTFNKSCDKTGNGLANLGTANTVDDSSDDIQFAEEQVYLGIKEFCAYFAGEKMALFLNDIDTAVLCRDEMLKIKQAIENSGWHADHYAVSLKSTPDKLNPNSIYKSVVKTSTENSNAYSIYTSNGFLYLAMAGYDIPWNCDRLKSDILCSIKKADTEYGCTHSNLDRSNIWISQNIWRDLTAGYLGIDLTDMAEKYWQFELYENTAGRGGCFIDTYGWNKLNYYPRGITGIGYLLSMGGISIDRIDNVIKIKPCRVPLKIPLLQFADWDSGRIPYVDIQIRGCKLLVEIENADLVDYMKINKP